MTTPPQGNPLPGWYPDPHGGGGYRYWDGLNWTTAAPPGAGAPPTPTAGTTVPGGSPVPPAKAGMSKGGKIALGVGGAIVLIGAISTAVDESGTKTKPDAPAKSVVAGSNSDRRDSPGTKAATTVAPVGSSVRDGKFEFRVLGIERGATAMEDAFTTERAKGEFFTVKLRVTNIGDEARTFSATSQKLIVNGNEYDATTFLDDSWMEDINPGLSIDAQATFDIPPGSVPEAIECHDSMFSGGALLALPSKAN